MIMVVELELLIATAVDGVQQKGNPFEIFQS
jgi:hypothetical protein